MNGRCVFCSSGFCTVLNETTCTGEKTSCSFRKSYKEFESERNRAIKINREKGNCNNCKYIRGGTACEYRELYDG